MKRRPSERIAYIDGACLGDDALRAQVMYLLDASETGAPFAPPQLPSLPPSASERAIEIEAPATPVVIAKQEEAPPPVPAAAAESPQAPVIEPAFDDEKTRIAPPPKPEVAAPAFDDEKTRVAPPPAPPAPPSSDDDRTVIAPAPVPTAPPVTGPTETIIHAPLQPGEMPTTGSRIGPYQLLHSLGQGGMGSVYAATRADQEYKKIVAIKLVTSELNSAEMLRRFRNERQVLAGLDHPGIARLVDGGTTDRGIPYLVMEFVEGLPIDRYCESNHLPLRDRLKLFQKVCDAIQYAHQNLVIHRDIKPGNIMVSATGEPKLLDFGIARLMTAEFSAEEIELSRGEAAPMTLRYASPEQVKGEPVSTASDQYSLGVLLYELITGRHPFQSALVGRAEIENAILSKVPVKPSILVQEKAEGKLADRVPPEGSAKLSRHLRGDLDAIALQVLRKEPKARYASVQSLSEDIGAYLNNLPVSARADSVQYRAGKFVHKHVISVVAAFVLLIGMAIATGISLRFARTAQFERTRAVDRFNDVRKLARFVLFDFDDALRDGVTPARKLLVTQALGYLNRLASDTGGDIALEKEIVDGYLKVGDLQGNPYVANLGDVAGAKQSYNKAAELAQAMRSKHPADPEVLGMVATVDTKTGALMSREDPASALKPYQEARSILEGLSADPRARRNLMHVLVNMGSIKSGRGDTKAALADFTRAGQIAQELYAANRNDADARELMATADERSGQALAAGGSTGEALDQFRRGLAIYEELAALSPQSPARRRIQALSMSMGDALLDSGKNTEAVESYRKALKINETLLAEDPKNDEYKRDIQETLERLSEALYADKQLPEAHAITERALRMSRPIVDAQGASFIEIYNFCWLLLTTPFKDLQDPAVAKVYAEKLVSSTREKDPNTLDLLARAQFGTGDAKRAAETETKAISLLPPNTQSDARKELESNLAKFRARAEGK
jgi:non-specific serine/threonine protein kinase/serine/threonine-protein kinase